MFRTIKCKSEPVNGQIFPKTEYDLWKIVIQKRSANKMKHIAILLAALLLSGCARFHAHTGDFSNFLLPALESHGAKLPEEIPMVDGLPTSWQAKPDRHGIMILAPHESFPEIDLFFRGIFGDPDLWTESTTDGFPMGVFNWRNTGCPIQYLDSELNTQIIILKKPRGAEQISAR